MILFVFWTDGVMVLSYRAIVEVAWLIEGKVLVLALEAEKSAFNNLGGLSSSFWRIAHIGSRIVLWSFSVTYKKSNRHPSYLPISFLFCFFLLGWIIQSMVHTHSNFFIKLVAQPWKSWECSKYLISVSFLLNKFIFKPYLFYCIWLWAVRRSQAALWTLCLEIASVKI